MFLRVHVVVLWGCMFAIEIGSMSNGALVLVPFAVVKFFLYM